MNEKKNITFCNINSGTWMFSMVKITNLYNSNTNTNNKTLICNLLVRHFSAHLCSLSVVFIHNNTYENITNDLMIVSHLVWFNIAKSKINFFFQLINNLALKTFESEHVQCRYIAHVSVFFSFFHSEILHIEFKKKINKWLSSQYLKTSLFDWTTFCVQTHFGIILWPTKNYIKWTQHRKKK